MPVLELTNAALILKKSCLPIYIIANEKPFIENNWQTPLSPNNAIDVEYDKSMHSLLYGWLTYKIIG